MSASRARRLAPATLLVLLAICVLPVHAATQHPADAAASLQPTLEALARRARPGTFGVAVLDLRSGRSWRVNADKAFPTMSVFKAPVAAAVLARIDRGELALDQTVDIRRAQLHPGPLHDVFQGERMRLSVRELLALAVSRSDNTAADALVRLAGGPAAVTAFLRAHGIGGMRIDMDEAGISRVFPAGPVPHETAAQEDARLHRGYRAFLADPRNRSTPDAAAAFLRKLWRGQLLQRDSTARLLGLMAAQTRPSRLRAGLPAGAQLADKCGTSGTLDGLTAAFNDIGILHWPDGRAVVVAAFLMASPASETERTALYAELARAVARGLAPGGPATHP